MILASGYRSPDSGRLMIGFRVSGMLDPTGLIPGAVLMLAAHDHYPFPFAPAGLLSGAALMDASGA